MNKIEEILSNIFYILSIFGSFILLITLGWGLITSGTTLWAASLGAFSLVLGIFLYCLIGQLLLINSLLFATQNKEEWVKLPVLFNIVILWPLLVYLVFKSWKTQK